MERQGGGRDRQTDRHRERARKSQRERGREAETETQREAERQSQEERAFSKWEPVHIMCTLRAAN